MKNRFRTGLVCAACIAVFVTAGVVDAQVGKPVIGGERGDQAIGGTMIAEVGGVEADGSRIVTLHWSGRGVPGLQAALSFDTEASLNKRAVDVKFDVPAQFSASSSVAPESDSMVVKVMVFEVQKPYGGVPSGEIATIRLPADVRTDSIRFVREQTMASDGDAQPTRMVLQVRK